MNDTIVRYQLNPMLTDTVGFFDYCIPLTNESQAPIADSLKKYYNFGAYDYVTPVPPHKQFKQTISVFGPHNLVPKHHGPLAIEKQSTDWFTMVFVTCLFIFAWIQNSYSKRLGQIFQAVAQAHYLNQLEREGNLFKERISLGLGFIFYSISAIFGFLIVREFAGIPPGLHNLTFAAIIMGGLMAYQLVKSSLIYLSGIIFDTREVARLYQLNIMIFNNVIGIILFPLAVVCFYWDNIFVLTTGIIIVLLLLIYRLFRGILTGLANKSYNLFYLFLYLCTLEILPLLLLYKVFSKM